VKNILGKKAEREGEGERVMEARRKWLRRQGGSETGGGGRGCHAQGGGGYRGGEYVGRGGGRRVRVRD
jgi:hypothetical protein